MPTTRITSFTHDHRYLLPGIYISDYKKNKKHGEITKFDLRFTRPNHKKISPKAIHSLEHLLAIYFSEYFKNDHIDLSPMGCRTGFYLTLFGHHKITDLPNFTEILKTLKRKKTVPFATVKTCGSATEHDLAGALQALTKFVKELQK